MKISIKENIAEKYPQYKMGLIKLKATNQDWEKLQTLTKYENTIADEAKVRKDWLSVFADMKASERRLPSVVALWGIISRFDELKAINYFVDAYNFVSVKHGIPMGGYDIDKLPFDEITLRNAVQGGVKFQPMGLNGQFERMKDPAEICYYSGDVPVCRYWNHKDSEITKIDDDTTEVLIMFDTLEGLAELETAMKEFQELIKQTSDTTDIKTKILSKENLTCEM